MLKICLVVLIGLPGAGKTTFCENYQKHVKEINLIHICYDEIIKFSEEEYHGFYKESRKKILSKIKLLINNLKINNYDFLIDCKEFNKQINLTNLNKNYNQYVILIDDNNYYVAMRYEFYKICREFEISFSQLYFQIEIETAIHRNLIRSSTNKIPQYVIERMNERLQIPNLNWEENTLYLNENQVINFSNVDLFLANTLNNPLKVPTKIQICKLEQSQIHKIDLILRKKIKNILETRKSEGNNLNLNIIAKNLNDLRKSILDDIRLGFLEIDLNHIEQINQLLLI